MLDEKGRCCGRRLLTYRTGRYVCERHQRYCPRCDRAYDVIENKQVPNWAWEATAEGFVYKFEKTESDLRNGLTENEKR